MAAQTHLLNGSCLVAAWTVGMLCALGARTFSALWTTIATAMIATTFGVLSIRQIPQWQNEWTLFENTLRINPDSHIVSGNLEFMLTPEERKECTLSAGQLEGMGDRLMVQRRSKLATDVYAMSVERAAISRT